MAASACSPPDGRHRRARLRDRLDRYDQHDRADFVPVPELAGGILWLWSVFALGSAAVAANRVIAPSDPGVARESSRPRACHGDAIAGGSARGTRSQCRPGRGGVARSCCSSRRSSPTPSHPTRRAERPRHAGHRLVSSAAALELLPPTPLGASERARLDASRRTAPRFAARSTAGPSAEPIGHGSGRLQAVRDRPVLGDRRRRLIRQALGPTARCRVRPPARPASSCPTFTNPAYVRYALKGTLAVMICYVPDP